MRWLLMVMLLLSPGAALAQAGACQAPATIPAPHPELPSAREPARRLPIGGYTLAMIWSPQYCRAHPGQDSFQCGGGQRFGFTLHGLWPDGEGKDWPQYCRPVSILPEALIRRHLCATPSAQLLQHEWAKHGSCMGSDPARYLDQEERLYRAIRTPDMDALSRRRVTAGGLAVAFLRANPQLPRGSIAIATDKQGWLEEVRICHDKALRPRACRADQQAAANGRRVLIWRGGRQAPRG